MRSWIAAVVVRFASVVAAHNAQLRPSSRGGSNSSAVAHSAARELVAVKFHGTPVVNLASTAQGGATKESVGLGSQTMHDHALSVGARVVRLCNAYALRQGLEAFHCRPGLCVGVRSGSRVVRARDGVATVPDVERLTNLENPLLYKQCEDFEVKGLGAGSVLEFRGSTGVSVGSFVFGDSMPPEGSMLLLVVFRHDRQSTVADFVSHVFEDSDKPQIALVDAYGGEKVPAATGHDAQSSDELELRSEHEDGSKSKWELVHFGTALALQPGTAVDWRLAGRRPEFASEALPPSILQLWVQPAQKYVAIRVGVCALDGPDRPEELVIFPERDTTMLQSKAGIISASVVASTLAALLPVLWS